MRSIKGYKFPALAPRSVHSPGVKDPQGRTLSMEYQVCITAPCVKTLNHLLSNLTNPMVVIKHEMFEA